MKTIDVNAERCIYIDDNNREYLITIENGHKFNKEPFKVLFESDVVKLHYLGLNYERPLNGVITDVITNYCHIPGAIGIEVIRFIIYVPDTSEKLTYSWSNGFDESIVIWGKIPSYPH